LEDAEKALREFFAKADPKTKMQIIVEVGLSSVYDDSIMKKFN
jgi:hypothetical protein